MSIKTFPHLAQGQRTRFLKWSLS